MRVRGCFILFDLKSTVSSWAWFRIKTSLLGSMPSGTGILPISVHPFLSMEVEVKPYEVHEADDSHEFSLSDWLKVIVPDDSRKLVSLIYNPNQYKWVAVTGDSGIYGPDS